MKTTSTLILLLFLCLFSFKLYAQDTITWTNLHNLSRNNGTHGLRYDSASALGSTPESKYGVAASTSALFPSDTGSFWFTVDSVTKEHTLYGLAWNNYVFCDIPGNNYPDGDTGTFPSLVFYIDISGGYAHLYNQDTLVEYFPVTSGDVIKMSKEYVDFSHPTYGGLIQLYINGLPTTPYISFCEPCFGLTGWAMNVGVVVERNGGGIDPVQCSFGSMGAFGTHNYSVVWDTLINADVDTLTIRTDTSDIETGPFGGGVSANKLLDTLDGYVQYLAIEPDLSVAAFTAFGLMSFVNDADIGNINYFAISAGAYSIYENSGLVGYFGSAQPGDILAIYRTGGYFKWFLNGDSLYTSSYNMFDYDWPTGEPDYSMQAFSEMLYPGSLFDLMASFPSPLDTPVISSTISGYCSGYGEPFTLSVTNPLWPHYRWFKNGTAIANSDSVSHYESSPPSASATYRAMVYDNLGDTLLSDTLTITVGPIVLNSHITNIYPCHGGSNGIDSLFVSGGSGVNNYQWPSYNFSLSYHGSSHAFYPVTRDMALIDDLDTGVYTLNVTDYNGCTATKQDTIGQPDTLSISITSSTNVSCHGGSNGAATVSASGGTAGYSYSWSPSGGTTSSATGLSAGTYTVTVADANGCTATTTITITQSTALTDSISNSTNINLNDTVHASAIVTPSGGTSPYTYSWSPSGGTDSTAVGLIAGTYSATVTDANGCTATFAAITFAIDSTIIAGQLLSFSTSPDSINAGDTLRIYNLSSGFPSGTIYIFQDGSISGYDSTGGGYIPVLSADTLYSTPDTIETIYSAPGVYRMRLTAVTPRGNSFGIIMPAHIGWQGSLVTACFYSSPSCNLVANGGFASEAFCATGYLNSFEPPYNTNHCGGLFGFGFPFTGFVESKLPGGGCGDGLDDLDGWIDLGDAICSWSYIPAGTVSGVYPGEYDYFVSDNTCTSQSVIASDVAGFRGTYGLGCCSTPTLEPGYITSPNWVPNNYWGSQADHTGGSPSAYIGLECYNPDDVTAFGGDKAIAIQKMSSPMGPGTYTVTFYVALAANSYYAVNGLGVKFATEAQWESIGSITDIQNLPGPRGADMSGNDGIYTGGGNDGIVDYDAGGGWTKITGTYPSPSGGEQYIFLGDFLTNGSTLTAQGCTGGCTGSGPSSLGPSGVMAAYYYFDDVSVLTPFSATAGFTINCPDPISFTAYPTCGSGDYTYLWSGPGGPTTNPASAPYVQVTAGEAQVTVYDAVTGDSVTVIIPNVPAGNGCRIAGEGTFADTATSVNVKLYPNPSTGNVTVIYQLNSSSGVLQLFDIIGKKVGEFILDGKKNEFEFDIGDLCCGIFEYKVMDSDALEGEGRLVIIR